MLALGGVRLTVDGVLVEPGRMFVHKGTMVSNVPNFAFCVGYTNASWTLRVDLASTLPLRFAELRGAAWLSHLHADVRSGSDAAPAAAESYLRVYRQGSCGLAQNRRPGTPWTIRQNYIFDMLAMKLGRMEDGSLKFGAAVAQARAGVEEEIATTSPVGD